MKLAMLVIGLVRDRSSLQRYLPLLSRSLCSVASLANRISPSCSTKYVSTSNPKQSFVDSKLKGNSQQHVMLRPLGTARGVNRKISWMGCLVRVDGEH
ncbi:hypothetical protein VTK26DRAFT_6325 [Humicola hyalothermophila]